MINEFRTKWQLWPKNVITQILQSLYNFISTLDGIGSAEESKSRRTPEELDLEGFIDISDQKENENWSHFLVKESIGVAICKYCQRKFKTVITNIHLYTERIRQAQRYFTSYNTLILSSVGWEGQKMTLTVWDIIYTYYIKCKPRSRVVPICFWS